MDCVYETGQKPGPTFNVDRISSAKGFPQIDWPPFPEPEGSPVWTMKPFMLRWNLQASYVPEAQRARKFSAVFGTASQKISIWGRNKGKIKRVDKKGKAKERAWGQRIDGVSGESIAHRP